MHEFTLFDEQNHCVRFHSPEENNDGWVDWYSLSLCSNGMNTNIRIENPPYGTSPNHFFESIAKKWEGWDGEINWRSLEGELSLTATMDKTGHTNINTKYLSSYFPPSWSAEVVVMVEAGLLQQFARQSKLFFLPTSNE